MNRKGFTLMELLLVVAVLAIVAAAAAPTFFGGAQDAMNEAKRSQFLAAYQNTLSGANVMISIAAAQGKSAPDNTDLLATNLVDDSTKTLNFYAPESGRKFMGGADGNSERVLKAIYVDSTKGVRIYCNSTEVVATATWDMIKNYN